MNNSHLNNFFVLTFALTAFLLGFLIGKLPLVGVISQKEQPQALNQNPELFLPPLPDEIFSVSGEIKAIENNVISLEIVSLTERFVFAVAPKMETRKITVAKDAKITKFDPFILPEIDKKTGEMKPFKQEVIKFSDLKIGDRITATAKENIKTKMEFEAAEIQLQILPELPELPA
ncbi:MAG: hypothetical protein AAB772_01015 [Patescibacteria group bacterium]